MVIVDANVLVYAVDSRSTHHRPSLAWLESALGGSEAVGFAWTVILAFLRLTTSRAILENPLDVEEASAQLERWLDAPAAVLVEPTARHLALVRGLLREAGTAANLVNDAHLAALALEHGASIVSFDRDVGRFGGVRLRLPGEPG